MTLVDSNVLLDVFIQTPGRWEWSLARLEDAARQGPLLINDVIFAETSIRFPVIEDFEAALSQAGITVAPIPRMALFLAGKASVQYRNAGGARSSVLPDFLLAPMRRSNSFRF
ncbi:putative nucleic acid-binding protein [Bradyrhizobium sp. AZCC 1721]